MHKMHFLNLPTEILMLLPQHFHSIIDLNSAAASCRQLHTILTSVSAKTILRLTATSSREYFRPDPHLLIVATARQIGDWARLSPSNTLILRRCIEGGIRSLFELCVSKAVLSLHDIRRFDDMCNVSIKPFTRLLDRCGGVEWFSTEHPSWVTDVRCQPRPTLFQLAIYGELFSPALDEVLNPVGPTASPPTLNIGSRLDYWRFCGPDYECWRENSHRVDDGKWELPDRKEHLRALRFVICSRSWQEAWATLRMNAGPDFEEEWRQDLWVSGVQLQGLQGFEMLESGGSKAWRARLEGMRSMIENLDVKYSPRTYASLCGDHTVASDAPIMARELLYIRGLDREQL